MSGGSFGPARAALAIARYRHFAIGNLCSLTGSWMQRLAVGWYAWELSHSGAWLGAIAMADYAPALALAPITGALADRYDRVQVMRWGQTAAMIQAALLGILIPLNLAPIELVFALALLLGVANAFNQPARLALVSHLVGPEHLPAAVAINSVTFNTARFLGPAVAAPVLALGGPGLACGLNALSYAGFFLAITGLKAPPEQSGRSVLADSAAGIGYLRRHAGIGPLVLLIFFGAIGARGMIDLLPGIADHHFNAGAEGFSALMAAIGVGAVAGGTVMMRRGHLRGLARHAIHATLAMALAVYALIATTWLWFGLIAVFCVGFFAVMTAIGAQTLVQTAAEPAYRGRVLALYGMIVTGSPSVGALMIGMLADRIGLPIAVSLGATVTVAGWIWAVRRIDAIDRALNTEG